MRRSLLAAALAVLASVPSAASPADDGRRLMAEGRYPEAVTSLEAAARENPGIPDILLNLGWAYWHDRRIDDAFRVGTTLVKLDPKNRVFLVFLANTHIERRQYRTAAKVADRALKLSPGDRDASMVLARALFLGGRQKDAMSVIKGVIAQFPDDSGAVYREAEFLSGMGRKQEALASLNGLLAADPANPALRRSRAKVLSELGRQDDAKAEWKGLAGKEHDPQALLNLGWAYWREKNLDEAWKAANILVKLDDANPVFLRFMANLEVERMNYPQALRLSRKAVSLAPDDRDAALILAKVLFRMQRETEARNILQRLIAENPENAAVQFRWAEFLARTGSPERSIPFFDRLVKDYPSNQTYRMSRSMALFDMGLFEAAVAEWGELAAQPEPNLDAQKRLRDDAMGREDYNDAARWQEKLIAGAPADPAGWERLSTFHSRMKQLPEALKAAEAALAADPGSINGYYLRAELLGEMQRYPEAEAAYADVLARNPNSIRALDGLSFVQQSEGRYHDALKTIGRIESLMAPNVSPYVSVRKARILANAGRSDDAQKILKSVQADPGPAIPVLLYHGLSRFERSDSVPQEGFRRQMRALKARGFQTISVAELDAALSGKGTLPAKPLVVSFDDGRTDSFENADPVLEEVGFRATMFVHVSKLRKPYFHASAEEIEKWQANGRWDVQAHGFQAHDPIVIDSSGHHGHFLPNRMWLQAEGRLETLDEYRNRIANDYEKARQGVEAMVPDRQVLAFAYPFGDYGQNDYSNTPESPAINQSLVRKNFRLAFVQEQYGINTLSSNPTDLRRFEVNRGLTSDQLMTHLALNDPRVQAELLEAELWTRAGQVGRAKSVYSSLEARGIDEPRVWVEKGAAFQKDGDLPHARALYAKASEREPDSDSQAGERARALSIQAAYAAAPSAFAEVQRFTDSDANAATKGILRGLAFAGPIRLEGWGGEASYRERMGPAGASAYIRGLEAGARLRWFAGSSLQLEGSYLRRSYSRGVSASAEEYAASLSYQLIPALELTVRDGTENYETAAAIRQGRSSHFDGVGAVWDPALGWRVLGDYDERRFNDSNRQRDVRARLTRKVSPRMTLGAGYARGDSRFRAPEYYTPRSLSRYSGVVTFSQLLGKVNSERTGLPGAEAVLQYEGGYATESSRSRVVHSLSALLALRPFDRLSLKFDGKYAQSPTYISRRIGATLGVSF